MSEYVYDLVIRRGTVVDGTGRDPFEADVAVKDGRIAAVGDVAAMGVEEIDARDLVVTPGFVDVHTHYDGQLTWSNRLSPSSGHGVTTVVTGNCGVGFAPCRPQDRDSLIRMMEGVEDIPEAVMAAGLPWDWESFPEFLNAVDGHSHDIDFAVLLPHSPLRVFVMGQRALDLEPATEADCATMRRLAAQAMEAGAIGFGTSRNIFHRASDGAFIASMSAEEAELREIALGLADAGRGVLQGIIFTTAPCREDYELFHRVARASGRPVSYTLMQMEHHKDLWREVFQSVERDRADGVEVTGQIFNRPAGMIFGLELSFHPFTLHRFYREHLADLPLAERVAQMRKPEIRERLLQSGRPSDHPMLELLRAFDRMYPMGDVADYEPDPSTSVAAVASVRGLSPEEVAYDLVLEREGRAKLFTAAANYADRNLDVALEMLKREDTVLALGDGGAHYGIICDASYPTTMLTHWVRDRARGERIGLAEAVRISTDKPARLHRFRDRGRIAAGLKANINIIDMDRLKLFSPTVVHDLPGGGKRLTQRAEGYVATFVSGVAIQLGGQETGARPGRLVRDAGA